MELVGPASGEGSQNESAVARLRVYFQNAKHLPPILANLCQVTTSPTMIQIDYGYLPPIEVADAAAHPQAVSVIVHSRITLELDTARQLRDLLDLAIKSASK